MAPEPTKSPEETEPTKLDKVERSQPEPALNPNVPEFVPSFVAPAATAAAAAPSTTETENKSTRVTDDPNDEAGTDGDTEEEPEDADQDKTPAKKKDSALAKTDVDWVEVKKNRFPDLHSTVGPSDSELRYLSTGLG